MPGKVDALNGTLGAIETALLRKQNAALKAAIDLDDDDEEGDDEDDDEGAGEIQDLPAGK